MMSCGSEAFKKGELMNDRPHYFRCTSVRDNREDQERLGSARRGKIQAKTVGRLEIDTHKAHSGGDDNVIGRNNIA